MGLPKYKQPKCKSLTVLTDPVFYLFMAAKLQFLSYVAGLLEPYLKRYQSDAPLVEEFGYSYHEAFCETR